MTASTAIVWADGAPEPVKNWVIEFYSTADSQTGDFAERFADLFDDDATVMGMGEPVHGKRGL